MKRIIVLTLIVIAIITAGCSSTGNTTGAATANIGENKATVFKSPSCGCCSMYIKYLKKQSNLDVDVVEKMDITPIKTKYDIPSNLRSCHTTIIGDYFVEGHVPIEAINKLMSEKPNITGIALPQMPSGSPGMPGSKTEAFVIYAVNKDGSYDEFMKI